MLFKAYVRPIKRIILCEEEIDINRALDFLADNAAGIIKDYNDVKYTKEELENVRDFGSKDRTQLDIVIDSPGEVPKDSYRELFGTLGNNTESNSKRDNQWD